MTKDHPCLLKVREARSEIQGAQRRGASKVQGQSLNMKREISVLLSTSSWMPYAKSTKPLNLDNQDHIHTQISLKGPRSRGPASPVVHSAPSSFPVKPAMASIALFMAFFVTSPNLYSSCGRNMSSFVGKIWTGNRLQKHQKGGFHRFPVYKSCHLPEIDEFCRWSCLPTSAPDPADSPRHSWHAWRLPCWCLRTCTPRGVAGRKMTWACLKLGLGPWSFRQTQSKTWALRIAKCCTSFPGTLLAEVQKRLWAVQLGYGHSSRSC